MSLRSRFVRVLCGLAVVVPLGACSSRERSGGTGQAASAVASSAASDATALSAPSVAPSAPGPHRSIWAEPSARAGLAASCGFSPPPLLRPELARQYETEADHDRCEVSLRDTCVLLGPDDQGCERAGNSCASVCGDRCGGCRGRCVASCESCKRDCTDEACRQRCGAQCADCHVACTASLDRCVTERCGRWSTEACQEEASQRAIEEGCEARCAAARPCTEACAALPDPARSAACRAACLARLDPTRAACVAGCDRRYPGRVRSSACEIECPGDRACEQRNSCLAACAPVCFMSCRQ